MDKAYVRSVYRRLYRASQAAVRHRGPQKYIIRDHLRHVFRTGTSMPSPTELANTEAFLWTAGRRRGIENNIVSGIMNMQWGRLYATRAPYSPLLGIGGCGVGTDR
jgi:hypothetical protein